MLKLTKPGPSNISKVRRYAIPARAHTRCLDILNHFFSDEALLSLPVINDQEKPLALVERHSFIEFFGKPYSHELFDKKSIYEFMHAKDIIITSPIVVEASTSIDDVADIVIGKGMQHMVSGFIITEKGRYSGVANGHDLLHEITQRRQTELYYLAHYDQLTKLPNRMHFRDQLARAERELGRKKSSLGVMFVDVDRFKQVNDSMGHAFGDQILQKTARRLQACARESDTVARLGGDEFAILLEDLNSAEDGDLVAKRILEEMSLPIQIDGRQLIITASIGIAIFPQDDGDFSSLLAKADAAMYETKRNGRNGFRRYKPGLALNSRDRFALETDLRNALNQNQFELLYQPQHSLINGDIVGSEALIRWNHPKLGQLTPGKFIDLAEESGLILQMGEWVLQEACRQIKEWQDAGIDPIKVSINVSALQFNQEQFCQKVKKAIEQYGISPRLIELELTESMVMHSERSVLETLNSLKAIGVHLALDDFGTGFSSLSYLQQFPIDRLKIDQSFVRDIDLHSVNRSIVEAISALARSLGKELVAEGTEKQAEVNILKAIGCQVAQGYFFKKPMHSELFTSCLQQCMLRQSS